MRKAIDLIAIFIFGAMVVYIASVVSSNGGGGAVCCVGLLGRMGGISQNLNHRILDSACISWACGIDLFAVLEESPIGVGGYERSLDYGFRQSLLFSLYLLRYVRSRAFHWRPAYAHCVILRSGYFWRSICL